MKKCNYGYYYKITDINMYKVIAREKKLEKVKKLIDIKKNIFIKTYNIYYKKYEKNSTKIG